LFIAPLAPAAQGNGLAMRTGMFLQAYARHFDIDLVIVPVAGQASDSPFLRQNCRTVVMLPVLPGTHFRLLTSLRDDVARLEAFQSYGRPSLSATVTDALCEAVWRIAREGTFAAVHVSRLYLAEIALALKVQQPWLRLLMDCDEDDESAQRSLAALWCRKGDRFRATWALAEAAAFRRLAATSLPRFDGLFVASKSQTVQLSRLAGDRATTEVANAVALPPLRPRRPKPPVQTILFVGTLNYAPNVEAIEWFVGRVWPRLRARRRVRLVIAGPGAPPHIVRLCRQLGIELRGFVHDLAAVYRAMDLVVVPLRAGGGTRIKLLEALSYGVPVVSTTFGAAGLAFTDGRDLLLADNAVLFIRACSRLLKNRALSRRLVSNARARVRLYHDRERVAATVGNLALQLTGRPATLDC
jgi:glycosyltransferase involved in cell wall biosynthesis